MLINVFFFFKYIIFLPKMYSFEAILPNLNHMDSLSKHMFGIIIPTLQKGKTMENGN